MSKRGLSFDEKKKRLLEYMQEHKDVFSLKELETNASKAKGIVSQTVKEVLGHLAETRVEKCTTELAASEAKYDELKAQLAEAQAARPTSQKRATDLKLLAQMKAQAGELEAEVGKFADSDPDRLKQLEKGRGVCVGAANRWTDNCQTLMAAIKESHPEMEDEVLLEQFSLPKNMDYIE